jgi:Ca2+-binding EF-hand superfamily protein
MGDDLDGLGGAQGGGSGKDKGLATGGGGGIDEDDFDEKNMFALLMNQPVASAEARFTQEELSKIKKEFDKLSKDQVIGKRKLLEYFRLMEINDTYLTNELFFMIKNSSTLNSPVDYKKFINFVSVIAKGSR